MGDKVQAAMSGIVAQLRVVEVRKDSLKSAKLPTIQQKNHVLAKKIKIKALWVWKKMMVYVKMAPGMN